MSLHAHPADRIVQIDALRFVAFAAVALLHVAWIETDRIGVHDVASFAARFAVPCFFLITGYLTGRRDASDGVIVWRSLVRLMPVFVVWELVYVAIDALAGGAFYPLPSGLAGIPRFLVVTLWGGGAGFHLWFLVWMAGSVAVFVALRRFGPVVMWAGVVALFVVGCAIGPYGGITGLIDHVGPLSNRPIAFTARNGPFFWPLFLAVGDLVARRGLRVGVPVASVMAIAGFAAIVVEGMVISAAGRGIVSTWDVTLGTPVYGLGVFLLFLAMPDGAVLRRLAAFGRLSLGAYCIHAVFTNAWNLHTPSTVRAETPFLLTLAVAALVVIVSLVSAGLLARVPVLRRFVV